MPKKQFEPQALIKEVRPCTPADDAGFYPGCKVTHVNGFALRDAIDWQWLTSDDEIVLRYIDGEGDCGEIALERDPGEDWGFDFEGAIYDRIRLCHNNCIFCFMSQLPEDVRDTLVLRDDDYRLSFLQGTFVTLTNIRPEDELRIIEQHISPLRFSLHCITPELRDKVIGGKKAAHGIEVAKRLMHAGIELHTQIVLMPDINDGEELHKTLAWAYEYPQIKTIGIVPLGFTKHQSRFEKSFNKQEDARAVIECIRPFQARALEERGEPWVFAADEFYRNAYPDTLLKEIPPTYYYGDFDMFEDGIGIIRSYIDDWYAQDALIKDTARKLNKASRSFIYITGCATQEFFVPLIEQSELAENLEALPVKNEYFGGNIDVTGLLCGVDIVNALKKYRKKKDNREALIPRILFNSDMLTLDNMTAEEIESQAGMKVHVVSCNASEYLQEIQKLIEPCKEGCS